MFAVLAAGLLLLGVEMTVFLLLRAGARLFRPHRRGTEREDGRRRVLVLTAPAGEGHVAAAHALVAELEAEDAELEVVLVDASNGLGRVLRFILLDLYRWQFEHSARAYGLLYHLLERFPFFRGIGQLTLVSFGSRSLLRLVEQFEADVIVSTYPPATAVLGSLRRRGKIRTTVVATITDLDGLCFWVDRGVDLHLVMHESCVPQVERLAGPGSARQARPLLGPAFLEPRTRAQARRTTGLPKDGAIAVVSGGGWGVGELESAVRAALAIRDLTVICLAGRNEGRRRRLERVFAAESRVRVWGFTDKMSDLLAAADVLVHSTGGVTVFEALARDCPVIAYGGPPGHANLTAKALAREGLGQMALSEDQLVAALRNALERLHGAARVGFAPSCARLVVEAAPRVAVERTLGARLLRLAALVWVALIPPGWVLSADLPYALAAKTLDMAPLTRVSTTQAQVGLVIRASPSLVPMLETDLDRHHSYASFAFSAPIDRSVLRSLITAGEEPLPELGSGKPMSWLGTRDRLSDLSAALQVRAPRYYLAPATLTFGEYLLARRQGALPVSGSRLDTGALVRARGFRRGEVIVLDLGKRPSNAKATLDELLGRLERDGLSAVSVDQLLGARSARGIG